MRKQMCLALMAALTLGSACATGDKSRPVKAQGYAELRNTRTFEYELPTVWKAIENVMRNHKVTERDPSEVDALEMRKLARRTLDTEWFYAQSRDKYQEYEANGSPRKVYLQTRIKYRVEAKRSIGGTDVTVKTLEEVERLNPDGTPEDYETSDSPDPSRANEILDRINQVILSGAS